MTQTAEELLAVYGGDRVIAAEVARDRGHAKMARFFRDNPKIRGDRNIPVPDAVYWYDVAREIEGRPPL